MSYQEIKKISRGRKWMIVALIITSLFIVFFKKIARAQIALNPSGCNVSVTSGGWTCAHNLHTVNYVLENYINRGTSEERLLAGNLVYKCEPVSAEFVPGDLGINGIWAGTLVNETSAPPQTCEAAGYTTPIQQCTIDPCTGTSNCTKTCSNQGFNVGVLVNVPDVGDCCAYASPCGAQQGCACSACSACGACGACGGACACGACGGACSACGPTADIIECDSLDTCLSQGTLKTLDGGNAQGKGVIDRPPLPNLIALSQNQYFTCSGNQCNAYAGGGYSFNEVIEQTKYYGQCVDTNNGIDMKLEGNISGASAKIDYTVLDRPPSVTADFANQKAMPEQEVNITCHAVDPDCTNDPAHMDKISRIKWSCKDAAGNSTGCYFAKGDVWHTGALTEDLVTTSGVTNDYETTVKFKGSDAGRYQVTCEAKDSDLKYPLTNTGIAEIQLGENAAANPFCKISHETGEINRTVCISDNKIGSTPVVYEADLFGFDDPNQYETYRWRCDSTQPDNYVDTLTNTHPCTYNYDTTGGAETDTNNHTPTLQMVNKDAEPDEILDCNNTISTKVTCVSKCSVNAWEKNTSNDRLSSFAALRNADISANLNKQCLTGGAATWNVIGGTKSNPTNVSLEVKLDNPSANQCKIQAYVDRVDSNTNTNVRTVCDEAVIDIKDKIKWGQ